jgi:hypothetical protein
LGEVLLDFGEPDDATPAAAVVYEDARMASVEDEFMGSVWGKQLK